MKEILIQTNTREEIIVITNPVEEALISMGKKEGVLLVFCPHTTCGLTINEGADPAVREDLKRFFKEIAPYKHNWAHMEGNTDAHIRASLLGASLLIPVSGGNLKLGTWQAIYFYEGDGPRLRKLWLQFLNT